MPEGVRIDLNESPGYFDASLKVGWAKHHLRALDVKIGEFLQGDCYAMTFQDDLEAGEHVVHLLVGDLPLELGLIVGDIVSCLRASLDHLACSLTLTKDGAQNPSASFPILGIDNTKARKTLRQSLIGVPPEAIKIIESLQPYHHGDAYKSTKLWRLHRLWNIDKHRQIVSHTVAASIGVFYPNDVFPIASGTEDGGIYRFPLAAKNDLHFEPPVKISIAFGDEFEGVYIPLHDWGRYTSLSARTCSQDSTDSSSNP